MTNTDIANFRENLSDYIGQAVEYNAVINVSTKNGNAVVMSEQDYKNIMETVYLNSVPGLSKQLADAAAEPLEQCAVYDENEEW